MPCEDAPCCGCCDTQNDYVSPELAVELEEAELYEPFVDEDDAAALTSAGFGTDEDYADDEYMACEGFDEY